MANCATDWVGWVNADEGGAALKRLRQSVVRGQPFGEMEWVTATIERFSLGSTIHSEDRPRKVLVENCS